MQKIWNIKKDNPSLQAILTSSLKIPPIIAQLLINRKITTPKEANNFLNPTMEDISDPFLLKDMDKAVVRIKEAILKKQNIIIYGDYDADGITSTSLLFRVLIRMGAKVITYIPNRLSEGYGMNITSLKKLSDKNIKLLIAVDCGTGSKVEVDYLKSVGIDAIIVDHHRVQKESFPHNAFAVINPFQEGCAHNFKNLAAVGLVYKLCWALFGKRSLADEYLDLVSIGTVSDVVNMLGENRILTKFGLEGLKDTKNIGLKALMKASSLKSDSLNTTHIGYILGPRINAVGRISTPETALRLLTTEDELEAEELAKKLNLENRSRQNIEEKILKDALSQIESRVNFTDHKVIVLENEAWHPGVIGIVASRIVERFYRPTIMIALEANKGKGSARSIRDFHLFDAISQCEHLLDGFGGHESACGISIHKDMIEDFRVHINSIAKGILTPEHLVPKLDIDMSMPVGGLSESVVEGISRLAPFGIGNPRPLFSSSKLKLKLPPKKISKSGVKMWVTDGKYTYEAIGFGPQVEFVPGLNTPFNIAYVPSIHSWQGIKTIQLDIKDIREL